MAKPRKWKLTKRTRRAPKLNSHRRTVSGMALLVVAIGTSGMVRVGRSRAGYDVSLSLLDWIPEEIQPWIPEEMQTLRTASNPSDTKIKIIGFSDHVYKEIAFFWYERMTRLGYNEHTIVATDRELGDFLTNQSEYRFEKILLAPLTAEEMNMNRKRRFRRVKEQMFAIRWSFILEQLENGISLVLTDVDNIFNKHIELSSFMKWDVIHAYEGSYPANIFEQQGFVVCGGMSWIKASPEAIRFVKMMVERCPHHCDDQVELNNLIPELDIIWDDMSHLPPPENRTDNGTLVLPTKSMSGKSTVTGHSVKIWSRDFAYRGEIFPQKCPYDNWVAMPFPYEPPGMKVGRWNIHVFKKAMFDQWDSHCGGSNATIA